MEQAANRIERREKINGKECVAKKKKKNNAAFIWQKAKQLASQWNTGIELLSQRFLEFLVKLTEFALFFHKIH